MKVSVIVFYVDCVYFQNGFVLTHTVICGILHIPILCGINDLTKARFKQSAKN